MNIVLVSQEYPPETARGGIGSQTFTKAMGLSALGHKIFVISRSVDDKRTKKSNGLVTVIRIPGMDNVLKCMTDIVQWLTHSIIVAAEIENLSKEVDIDIIDFPEWAAEGYTYLLNRQEKKIPVVIQLHGPLVMFAHVLEWPDMKSIFYRVGTEMESISVQMADGIYSSSACSAGWIKSSYDPTLTDIPTIHLGIDTGSFVPANIEKYKRPTIIFTGKMVKNKGVTELVEAAIMLREDFPDLQLRMLGGGDKKIIEELKNICTLNSADDLLEFAGYVHKDQLPIELSKAHVFAAPSYYEGGPGFVYLEAMAAGLPVVACSGSGVDEIITSGKNGILVPPKNAPALKEAIKSILSDDSFSKKLSEAGRNFVVDEADSKKCVAKLESYYIDVITRCKAGKNKFPNPVLSS